MVSGDLNLRFCMFLKSAVIALEVELIFHADTNMSLYLPVRFLDILPCVHVYHMDSHHGMRYTKVRFKIVGTVDSNRENVAVISSFLYNFYWRISIRVYMQVEGKR